MTTTIQFDQQANGASSVAPSIPGRVLALISTGDTTMTRESMEAIFKTWTVTQTTPLARLPHTGGRKKHKSKLGANYIPNDKPNGERTLRQYPNLTNYYSTHGYNIKPDHHSGNCPNRGEFHNELATIEDMLGGVTTNCFHHAGWKP